MIQLEALGKERDERQTEAPDAIKAVVSDGGLGLRIFDRVDFIDLKLISNAW